MKILEAGFHFDIQKTVFRAVGGQAEIRYSN